MSARASACGKFILAGEHSIALAGGRALAFPLPDLRLTVELGPGAGPGGIRLNGQPPSDEARRAVLALLERLGAPAGLGVAIESRIPIGSGLGSSAALSTAVCRALAHTEGAPLEGLALARRAFKGEEVFHLKPSGVDPFTIALEQPLDFTGLAAPPSVLSLDRFREQNLTFALFDSGQPHRTACVQAAVEARRAAEGAERFDARMARLRALADDCHEALATDPQGELGSVMTAIHDELAALGVANAAIESARARALATPGCLAAKITGAGCGGFVLALFDARLRESPSFPQWESSGLIYR